MYSSTRALTISCRATAHSPPDGRVSRRKSLTSRKFLLGGAAAALGVALSRKGIRNRAHAACNRLINSCIMGHQQMSSRLLVVKNGAFLAQHLTRGGLLSWGLKSNAAISAGQWWRLATPAFLHADIHHLAFNSLMLWILGSCAEPEFGPKRFLAVFAASNMASFATSYKLTPVNSVGSSGAVYGLASGLAVHHLRHRCVAEQRSYHDRRLLALGCLFACALLTDLLTQRFNPSCYIDRWGHVGGLVGGALTTYMLETDWSETLNTGCLQPCTASSS